MKHIKTKKNTNLVLIGPFVQLLTMDGLRTSGPLKDEELRFVKNGGIVVHEGNIVAVGNFDELRKEGYKVEEVPFPAVAMPGLIDAHTHCCYAGSRSSEYAARLNGATYEQIATTSGGVKSTMRETRAASQEHLVELLIDRAAKLLADGVTTAEVKSGYGLNVTDEVKILRVIEEAAKNQPVSLVSTCMAAHVRPPEFDSSTEYLSYLQQDLLVLLKKLNLTKRVDICVDKVAFSVDQARNYLKTAQELGFSISIHADQFTRGGSGLAAELHASSADHLEQSTNEDFALLKQANVIPIVLPGASLGLGMPFANARAILDHDLPLVIASDWNPGSAPMGNLLLQASLLGMAQKLSIAETFAAITIRAAKALQLNDRGALTHGARADLIAFPCENYRDILYNQGSLSPSITYIKGSSYET